uniref:Uncharacterized protein n=1 Tax=Arundo donax TaxID=35708 RepID=A0A0A9C969_ARUDO
MSGVLAHDSLLMAS